MRTRHDGLFRGAAAVGSGVWFLTLPLLAAFGGSTSLMNWGPGLLLAGGACWLLGVEKSSRPPETSHRHLFCLVLVLSLLLLRAAFSPVLAASLHDITLISFALIGYLIGSAADARQSRMLLLGLAAISIIHGACALVQVSHPEWTPIYPGRSGSYPCGLFAHYNHAATFGLGAAGLLLSRTLQERGWQRYVFALGLLAAVLSVMLSLSRGGNLALAVMLVLGLMLLLMRALRTGNGTLGTWLAAGTGLFSVVGAAKIIVPTVGSFRGQNLFESFNDGGRLSFCEAAWRLANERLLLGGGSGSFSWEVFRVLKTTDIGAEPVMVHNEPLQLLTDYGVLAVVGIAAVIIWPLILCGWRYISGSASHGTAWEAIGLVGMLVHANFDFVFHVAPCTFVAAIILGRISRGGQDFGGDGQSAAEISKQHHHDHLLIPAKGHARAYLAGQADSTAKMTALLLASREPKWLTFGYELICRTKNHNPEAVATLMHEIDAESDREMADYRQAETSPLPPGARPQKPATKRRISSNAGLAALAICALVFGARLSQALAKAWMPIYHPQRLSDAKRFEQLLDVLEKHPYLGIDREMLTACLERLSRFESLEAREYWAEANLVRVLPAVRGWRYDPAAALQLASLVGWTGDMQTALEMYNRAILLQARHEATFMAQYFKGEYFYELALSAGAVNQQDQQKSYAQQAVASLQASARDCPSPRARDFKQRRNEMLRACETF